MEILETNLVAKGVIEITLLIGSLKEIEGKLPNEMIEGIKVFLEIISSSQIPDIQSSIKQINFMINPKLEEK